MTVIQPVNPSKVGVITYHSGFNYGAFLQVYGLQTALESLGLQPEIVNYKSRNHTYWEFRCLFWTKRFSLLWNNFGKMRAFFRAHRKLRMSRAVSDAQHLSALHYPCVVFGSDEIWNYSNPIVKLDPVYFGQGVSTARRVSYAASCGSLEADTVVPEQVARGWQQFDHLAVRDENSRLLVAKHVTKPIEEVLDPTFLVDFTQEEVKCSEKDFILVYTTGFSPEMQQAVKQYARSRGQKLVSVGYRNAFCDENVINIGPFEFLGYYRAASEVITSMFHGTIFAIKYNKPVAVVVDPYRTNKLATMLKRFGMTNRVTDVANLGKTMATPIDYANVNSVIKSGVAQSMDYLKRACSVGA